MDAAQAVADLMEISSQVPRRRSSRPTERSRRASPPDAGERSRARREACSRRAGGVRTSGDSSITQLEAAAREGSFFVVRDGEPVVAATTGASPTVGLVFYDLKTCLRSLAGPDGEA